MLAPVALTLLLAAQAASANEREAKTPPSPRTEASFSDFSDALDITTGASRPDAEKREAPERAPDLRLVITGGLAGVHDGYEGFYQSPVFADPRLPLVVEDAAGELIASEHGYFFANGALDDATLIAAGATSASTRDRVSVLFGAEVIAFSASPQDFPPRAREELVRSLTAVARAATLERRTVGSLTVYGVNLNPETPLVWPTAETPLTRVRAARARYSLGERDVPVFFAARRRGASARAFGILDQRLRDESVPTAYVDAGGSLTGKGHIDAAAVKRMQALLDARRPAALGVGRAELSALTASPDALSTGPFLVAAAGSSQLPPASQSFAVGGHTVHMVAVGDLGSSTRALLPSGSRALSSAETFRTAANLAKDGTAHEGASLVLGLALSDTGEGKALASSTFDAVLHLVSSKTGALAAVDDIDLRPNHEADVHAAPGLVRVSNADVTEAYFWLNEDGRLERLRIVRTPVVDDGAEAADAVSAVLELRETEAHGLPARAQIAGAASGATYTEAELSTIRAQLVRDALDGEVAILPVVQGVADVSSPVPNALASAWLEQREPVLVVRMTGAQLIPVLTAAKALGGEVVVAGANAKAKTVARRPVSGLETYRVLLTPSVAQHLVQRGAKVPAEARRGPRISALVAKRLGQGLDEATLATYLRTARGESTHALFAEVSQLALALSGHRIDGNEGLAEVRDARIQIPSNFSVTVDAKGQLTYDGPWLESSLMGQAQFSRVTQESVDGAPNFQEARDLALVEGEARLKLLSLVDLPATQVPSPTARVSYQTEWTPNLVVDEAGTVFEQPRRSELRGTLGLGFRPAPWLKDLRLGLLVENDFASAQSGAFEWGGEAALSARWNTWRIKWALDAMIRSYMPDPGRDTPDDLGLVTQVVARADVATLWNLNLGAFVDVYAARGKLEATKGPAVSLIAGISLGYSQRLKWLPLGVR